MLNYDSLKLAMFDLDGTLIEFPKAFLFSQTVSTYKLLGLEPPSGEIMEESFINFNFFEFVPKEIEKKFMDVYWESFDWNSYPSLPVLPGVLETLEFLKNKGMKIAITTSRAEPPEEVREGLKGSGLLDYIEHIETRESPDAEWSNKVPQIRTVCKKFDIKPENSFLAGDVPPDILSGKNAGVLTTIAVKSGGVRTEVLEKSEPDLLLGSVAEINVAEISVA